MPNIDLGTIVESFEAKTGWTASGAAVLANSTTTLYGTRSLAFTTDGTARYIEKPRSAEDWSAAASVSFRYYIPDARGVTYVKLQIYTGAADYFEYTGPRATGWNHVLIPLSAFSTGGGTPDWATVAKIRIYQGASAGYPDTYNTVHYDVLSRDYGGPATVLLTSDDGRDENINLALPILSALGLKATAYIITSRIDSLEAAMTRDELDTLRAAGWNLASHSVSHQDLTQLTEAQQITELEASRDWLTSCGYGPTAHFSYPFSAYNTALLALVQTRYATARLYATTYAPHPYISNTPAVHLLPGISADALTVQQFTDHLDAAIAQGGLFVPYYHTYSAAFADSMAYLAGKRDAGLCQCLTLAEYWSWLVDQYEPAAVTPPARDGALANTLANRLKKLGPHRTAEIDHSGTIRLLSSGRLTTTDRPAASIRHLNKELE